ncbi:UbiX family flavin prenyltransferase [Rhizobium johnstonii]|uniref:UbiX family flavin prenyltransferase n=1 Tax=Rhizobium johnstonii TaxID=3019933 RepID=UPI003F95C919
MKRLIIAITGASGAIYGIRALELLRPRDDIVVHLVISPSGVRTIASETDYSIDTVRALADEVHNAKDIGAPISSGSFITAGMLIAPCSIKTLSGIANSYDEGLVVRAADVCLKERRRLVLMLRETPLHAGHIDLMAKATASGAIIMPPVPAFYHRPATVLDIVDQSVCRALDLFHISIGETKRWTGQKHGADVAKIELSGKKSLNIP